MQSQSFKHRVIRSSVWALSGNVITQVIRFVSNLIMTRLLAPEMFGLMALAGVFIFGLTLLSDIGLRQILIQNKRSDERFVNTVWTIQVIRGWLIWLLSAVVATVFYILAYYHMLPANSVYADAAFPFIVGIIGVNSVISGYESTKLAFGNRNLNLKINVAISLMSQVIGFVVMIIWAYVVPNVWALVAGSIAATLSQTIASYLMIAGKGNYFCLDKEVFHEIFHFGKWIFISSLLGFLLSSSDKLIFGGLLDAKLLGYYAIAGLLVGAITQLLSSVIHSVGFSALSETVRENPENLKKVFYKLRLPFDATLGFCTGLLYFSAHAIVALLYDARYADVAWMFQILAISLLDMRYKLAGECFMAMGKPKLMTLLISAHLLFLYVFGYWVYKYFGFEGAIWLIACGSMSTMPINLYYLYKFKLLDWKLELLVLPMIALGGVVGVLLNLFLKQFV